MRSVRSVCGWVVVLWAALGGAAQAHAHLQGSTPRDGSTLDGAPASLVLQFSEPARLTALWIEKQGGEKKKLAPPQDAQSEISITLPKLEPGEYLVTWRVQGNDGHVVPGKVRFTVRS
jgi:methionine-rich copper-binding protein CopC